MFKNLKILKMKKFSSLFILFLIIVSCSDDNTIKNEQITENSTNTERNAYFGKAFMGLDRTEFKLGKKHNLLVLPNQRGIKYINSDYDANIIEVSSSEYKIYPSADRNAEITLKNIQIKGNKFLFNFKVDSNVYTMGGFEPGEIVIDEPVSHSWWPVVREIIKEVAKQVIINEISESLTDDGGDDDCTDKAIRGCGEGNVQSVDEGGWFSGCSYTCY